MLAIEYLLLIGSVLILLSIAFARLSDNLGVPTMLLFIGIGMVAGSEGPGGIYFDDMGIAQAVGIVALVFILFAGGLDTNWSEVRPIARNALSLSTIGVFLTAVITGVAASAILGIPPLIGFLLGAIISSTDAAAVFSVLRSKNVSLRGSLQPLLELESGSNDPMAVFLTIACIQLATVAETSVLEIAVLFGQQMAIGGIVGIGGGRLLVLGLNRMRMPYEGLYPVSMLAVALFVYGVTTSIGGSGFLAVYVAAIVAGNADLIQKKSMIRFFDGLAWLGQIAVFITLGLLVFPSQLQPVIWPSLIIAFVLMFLARPIGVFISLIGSSFRWRDRLFVSWVGLRGAVPIILATFPLLSGVEGSAIIFNVVFFIVLTSALFQGWSIPLVARVLKVDAPFRPTPKYPLEFFPLPGSDTELLDFIVPYESSAIGKSLVELGLPSDSLVVLISRNDNYLVPSGGTQLEAGDTLLVLVSRKRTDEIRGVLEAKEDR